MTQEFSNDQRVLAKAGLLIARPGACGAKKIFFADGFAQKPDCAGRLKRVSQ
jgi:hypothetical protein